MAGDKLRSHHGKKCFWCARIMQAGSAFLRPTRDHVHPKARGGTVTEVCCFACNHLKGDMHPALWKILLEKHPYVHDMAATPGPRGMALFYYLFGGKLEPHIDRIVAEAMQRFPQFGKVRL